MQQACRLVGGKLALALDPLAVHVADTVSERVELNVTTGYVPVVTIHLRRDNGGFISLDYAT